MKLFVPCMYMFFGLVVGCGDAVAQATFSAADVRDAISRFGPIMKLHPSEKYKMDDPEAFLKAVKPNIIAELIKNPGSYDYEESQIKRISVLPPDHIFSVEKALPSSVSGIYNNPDFKAFLEIPNKASVLAGDQARASRLIEVSQQGNSLYLAFWFFYPFNGPGRAFLGPGCNIDWKDDEKGRHFGDWEHVTLKVQKAAGKLSLFGIYLSRHSFSPWYGGKLSDSFDFRGEHPIIFIAINSHAHYPKGGHDYIYDDNYHGPGDNLRVCAYDSPRDGGQEFDTSLSDKRRIISSNISGLPAEQNNWYQFTLAWGQYIRNKTDYTVGADKESENGPSGPIEHGPDQLHFAHTPSAFGFSNNAIYALVDTDDKKGCCDLQHNDFLNNRWNGWNGGFQWQQGQYTVPPKMKQISMVTFKTGLGLFSVGNDDKLYANMRTDGYWQQSWHLGIPDPGKIKDVTAGFSSKNTGGYAEHKELFALRASDGSLLHSWYDNQWHAWGSFPISVPLTSVKLFRSSENLFLVALGSDGTLYSSTFRGEQNWSPIVTSPGSSPKLASIVAAEGYPVRLLGVGLDGKIYHASYSGNGNWTSWAAFTTPMQKVSFVAITPSLHYEAFAVSSDGTLLHNYNDGSWHDWGVHGVTIPFPTSVFQVGGFINNVAGHLEVFTFNGDDQISHTWQDNYYSWQGWERMFFDGSAELRSQ